MQYILYTRQHNSQGYHWPWVLVIEAWWEFQPTWLFTAEYTLFWIFWDDDLANIDAKYSPVQYTPQWAVDLLNSIYTWDYFSLGQDWFTIIDWRPQEQF